MKKFKIGELEASQIILGCMRINEEGKNPVAVIEKSVEQGINFFDHADIYGGGACESIFTDALEKSSVKREDIILQSKCGIVPGKCSIFQKNILLNRLRAAYLV